MITIIIVNTTFAILHVGKKKKCTDVQEYRRKNKYFEQESTHLNPYDVLAKKNILLNSCTITNS